MQVVTVTATSLRLDSPWPEEDTTTALLYLLRPTRSQLKLYTARKATLASVPAQIALESLLWARGHLAEPLLLVARARAKAQRKRALHTALRSALHTLRCGDVKLRLLLNDAVTGETSAKGRDASSRFTSFSKSRRVVGTADNSGAADNATSGSGDSSGRGVAGGGALVVAEASSEWQPIVNAETGVKQWQSTETGKVSTMLYIAKAHACIHVYTP
jgi:hypothetical protein